MPDPKTLKVGDRVRFVSIPEEWSAPDYSIHASSVRLYKKLMARSYSSRIREIDEFGVPWIEARVLERGERVQHSWGILEQTGWRKVEPRAPD